MLKDKKGFTLVELLTIIVLIGLLFGIGVPGVMKISERMKEKSYNTKIDIIEKAGILWGQDNKTLLQTHDCDLDNDNIDEYKCHKMTINDLIVNDYLESDGKTKDDKGNIIKNETGDIIYEYNNPKDNTNMANNCIYIYKKNNRVYSYYSEKEC